MSIIASKDWSHYKQMCQPVSVQAITGLLLFKRLFFLEAVWHYIMLEALLE